MRAELPFKKVTKAAEEGPLHIEHILHCHVLKSHSCKQEDLAANTTKGYIQLVQTGISFYKLYF